MELNEYELECLERVKFEIAELRQYIGLCENNISSLRSELGNRVSGFIYKHDEKYLMREIKTNYIGMNMSELKISELRFKVVDIYGSAQRRENEQIGKTVVI